MAKPDKFPEWSRLPYVDPVVGGNNVVEPPDQQKDTGWLRKQKPPAQYTNYLFKKINEWLEYFDAKTSNYAVTTGTQPNYIVTLPGITSYENGLTLILFIHATNAGGAATVNLNGFGAKNLVGSNGNVFAANDLDINLIYTFTYQGSEFILSNTQPASETNRGLIRIATAAEVKAGTNLLKAMVPGHMSKYPTSISAWANFTGSTGAINDQIGITSVTKTAVGTYDIVLANTMSNANYCIMVSSHVGSVAQDAISPVYSNQTITGFTLETWPATGAKIDVASICISVVGKLA